ncbi:MAG: hypothetical protein NT157_01325 [Candidatus Micrarchaeota archaeon]|nr:hypothetical protein [Candidatus Micrarchaeota archaeon]
MRMDVTGMNMKEIRSILTTLEKFNVSASLSNVGGRSLLNVSEITGASPVILPIESVCW